MRRVDALYALRLRQVDQRGNPCYTGLHESSKSTSRLGRVERQRLRENMSSKQDHFDWRRLLDDAKSTGNTSRLVATLVLVPSVPMLLGSIAALALFYLAPTRFGELINRLPGETFIRTALVFAPATLFAIVVLAALYAVEKPDTAREVSRVESAPPRPRAAAGKKRLTLNGQRVARISLTLLVPALLFSVGLWGLSFISPGRFERLIEPLPGDRFLRPLVGAAPIVLFALTLIALLFAFARHDRKWLEDAQERIARITVRSVLVLAVPAFLLTLGALILLLISPEGYARVVELLSYEEFIRLVLAFAPAILLATVILAVLYLRRSQWGLVESLKATATQQIAAAEIKALRARIAPWILVAGLTLTTTMGLGLLGAGVYLLLK